MGLRSNVIFGKAVFCAIVLSVFITETVPAEWVGPRVAVIGTWGSGIGQFHLGCGGTFCSFPRNFGVDSDGNVRINDNGNRRVQKYDRHGVLVATVTPPEEHLGRMKWPNTIYVHQTGSFIAASSKRKFFYSTEGDLVAEVNGYYEATPSIEGYYLMVSRQEYHLLSPKGKLVKRHKNRPPDFGTESSVREGRKQYTITVSFPDGTYLIKADKRGGRNVRDLCKNLYRIGRYVRKDEEHSNSFQRVYRCDPCSQSVTVFETPRSSNQPLLRNAIAEQRSIAIEEYGDVFVSPRGNIYCWKRTPDTYSILKWTWQGEATAPQSLESSASDRGELISLCWEPPREDSVSVTEYEILRANEVCGPFHSLGKAKKSVLRFDDRDLKPGDVFYYHVRAIRDKEYSGYSNKAFGSLEK